MPSYQQIILWEINEEAGQKGKIRRKVRLIWGVVYTLPCAGTQGCFLSSEAGLHVSFSLHHPLLLCFFLSYQNKRKKEETIAARSEGSIVLALNPSESPGGMGSISKNNTYM